MKLFVITLFSAATLLFYQCSPTVFKNYHAECVSVGYDGYIELKISNSIKKYSSDQAEKEAIHFLLYSGFVGGQNCQTQAPILRNDEEIKRFKNIEHDFFDENGAWRRFVKSNTQKNINQNFVFVSRDQLINYLQEKQIIKSLNSGF